MILYVILGLMAALAAWSWFDYRRTGGRPQTDADPFADAPEWGDERDLGLRPAHPISHAEVGGDDAEE